MNKESTGHDFAVLLKTWSRSALGSRCVRLGLVAAAGVTLALNGPEQPHAQQRYKEPTVTVTSVSSSGNTVSISADGSLNRAQTWQDAEGFHVVLVNGEAAGGAGGGVKVRRVGSSLELVVPVKRGANVTVQPRGNRLDLVVTGGQGSALNVENFPVEPSSQPERSSGRAQTASRSESAGEVLERVEQSKAESKRRSAAETTAEPVAAHAVQSSTPAPTQTPPLIAAAQTDTQAEAANTIGPAPEESNKPTVAQPAAATVEPVKDGGLASYLLSLPSLFALVGVGLAGSVGMFVKRRRAGVVDESDEVETKNSSAAKRSEKSEKPFQHFKGDRRRSDITVPFDRRTSGRGAEDEATRRAREMEAEAANGGKAEHSSESKSQQAAPSFLYGSYRIDQEVASLVAGGP
ncbi:MAG TPA: hypothetical protein VNZ44_20655, partial [Pyrinomonadaceae bacterium]|nr:hypothetical protein [Pyrinomonadaceae bacterium]